MSGELKRDLDKVPADVVFRVICEVVAETSPEVGEQMSELANKIYQEHFAGKRNIREYIVFVGALMSKITRFVHTYKRPQRPEKN